MVVAWNTSHEILPHQRTNRTMLDCRSHLADMLADIERLIDTAEGEGGSSIERGKNHSRQQGQDDLVTSSK